MPFTAASTQAVVFSMSDAVDFSWLEGLIESIGTVISAMRRGSELADRLSLRKPPPHNLRVNLHQHGALLTKLVVVHVYLDKRNQKIRALTGYR